MVEEIDTDFLYQISCKDNQPYTNLLNNDIVHQDKVWEDILKNGMLEPLLIRISLKTKEIRLESGNHRIKTAIQSGIKLDFRTLF